MSEVAKNIKARVSAFSVFELIGEQSPRFWEVLAELVADKLPPKPSPPVGPQPLSDKEAEFFERTAHLTYGKYAGKEQRFVIHLELYE